MRKLVIEDDEGIAADLRIHLRQHGCVVEVVASIADSCSETAADPSVWFRREPSSRIPA